MAFENRRCCELLLLTVFCLVYGVCQDFGYDGEEGPTHWGKKYHQCIGKHQSPIDIDVHNISVIKFAKLHFENFDIPIPSVKLVNNGHTVQMTILKGKIPWIHGGPLKGIYNFAQLHFHWGQNDTLGSENMINNHSFPLELHMVFFKKEYNNFKNAINHYDGLTVLSFLYSAVESDNKNYAAFEKGLDIVHDFGKETELTNFVSLDQFTLKQRQSYFAYEGSLTTPPCSEGVVWIEFTHMITLSHKQIQGFRMLYSKKGQITHNFRPTQPLHDRIIYMNYSGAETIFLNAFLAITLSIIVLLW